MVVGIGGLILPFLLLLVGEKDHDAAEQLNKVNEQVHAMPRNRENTHCQNNILVSNFLNI